MIKRYSKILIGLIIAAVIAVGAYAGVSTYTNNKDKKALENDQKRYIFNFDGNKIKSLNIKNESGFYSFDKNGDSWIMTEGDDITLSSYKLTAIANAMSDLTADHILSEDEEDLGKYGLDDRMVITAVMYDGSENTIMIGSQVPGDSRYYAAKPGDKTLYLLSSIVVDNMWADRNDLRDSYMFDMDSSSEVTYLKYIEKGKVIFEVKQNSGSWEVLDPVTDISGNSSAITNMLTEIIRTKSMTFIDDESDLSKYGLDKPQFEIVLEGKSRKADYIFGDFYDDSEQFIYAQDKVTGQISVFETEATGCYGAKTEDILFKRLKTVKFEDMDTFDIDLLGTKIDIFYHYSNYDSEANVYRVNGINVDHNDETILDAMNNMINAITGMGFDNYLGGDIKKPETEALSHIIYNMLDGSKYSLEFYPEEGHEDRYMIFENGKYLGVTINEETFYNGVLSYYHVLMDLIK